MVPAIKYDLRRPGQDDEVLYAAIKNCADWWHFLDSQWLVDTTLTPDGIWTRLQRLDLVRFQTVHLTAHHNWDHSPEFFPPLQSEQRPPRRGGRTKELVCALYD